MDNVHAAASAAASTGFFSPQVFETIKSAIGYGGVLAAAIVSAFIGIRKAIKDLRKAEEAPLAGNNPAAKVIGATILESTTLLMWSESNRDVVEAIESQTRAINYNTEALREVCRDLGETRHQIERLRDKMS